VTLSVLFPDIIFLSKTLVLAAHIDEIKITLCYDYCLIVDTIGSSGGLTLV